MEKLFEIQQVIIEQFEQRPYYPRALLDNITCDNALSGIVGPRGIGKTTLLLKKAIQAGATQHQALYVSADNLYFLENRLIDLADKLYKETKVRLLCIDEIHKYPNWEQELKNISDLYSSLKVLFTSSSMIDIIGSKFDLSRRVTLYHLHGLSFREYLEFFLDFQVPMISFETLIKSHLDFAKTLNIPKILMHFNEYLKTGYYPFFKQFTQEHEKFQAIENTTQKAIYEDIATCHNLKTSTLSLIEKLFKFAINSSPGEFSAYKLAKNLRKDFNSISEYLTFLEQSGLLRFLYPNKTGHAYLRNPAKTYPENTNLMYASYLPQMQENTIGKIRETFALNQLQNANQPVFYHTQGDFSVNHYLFEIGGKNKAKRKLKKEKDALMVADGILLGSKTTIPLYLFGFLY